MQELDISFYSQLEMDMDCNGYYSVAVSYVFLQSNHCIKYVYEFESALTGRLFISLFMNYILRRMDVERFLNKSVYKEY